MLRAYCVQLDSDCEDALPWLLLAVREVTQASTGFSPNELVFGHTVRGPVASLMDSASNEPPQTIICCWGIGKVETAKSASENEASV